MGAPSTKSKGLSPWQLARKRFLRNYPAVGGLVVLILCALLAIFAYFLIPDQTKDANFQVLELAKRPPGTKTLLLLKPKNRTEGPGESWIKRKFYGETDHFEPIPVLAGSVKILDENLVYTHVSGLEKSLLLDHFLLPGNQLSDQMIERRFWAGTDGYGRDVLSRLVLGTRVSLSVGLLAVIISLLIGVTLGALSGFFRGWVDSLIMWFISVVWSIPTLLLAISISFAFGKGFWQVFVAIGLSMWVEVARIVRGQIFSVREMQFVEATRALGFKPGRAILRHILPNIMGPVIIIAAANFAAAILIEAGLSFLGVGVQAPLPSWGTMIREGYTNIIFESGKWLAIFPGLAIVIVVISLNLVGFGLRDALDPKMDHSA